MKGTNEHRFYRCQYVILNDIRDELSTLEHPIISIFLFVKNSKHHSGMVDQITVVSHKRKFCY